MARQQARGECHSANISANCQHIAAVHNSREAERAECQDAQDQMELPKRGEKKHDTPNMANMLNEPKGGAQGRCRRCSVVPQFLGFIVNVIGYVCFVCNHIPVWAEIQAEFSSTNVPVGGFFFFASSITGHLLLGRIITVLARI